MENVLQKTDRFLRQFVQEKMNYRHLTSFVAAICLTAAAGSGIHAQDYVSPQVTVTTDKVRCNGRVFYSHVVQERQTLYAISKAYNVTLQEIYDANPTLKLETEGLKKDQILLIPVKGESQQGDVRETAAAVADAAGTQDGQTNHGGEYLIHRVKWFEDLDMIAKKYDVSKEAIMNINGMTSDKVKRKDDIKIPLHPEKWKNTTASVRESSGDVSGTKTAESATVTVKPEDKPHGTFVTKKHKTSMSLLLPFNTAKKADSQMMDFYSGVLLASKDLGDAGDMVEMNVYDVAGGSMPVTEDRFSDSDFVIGPVSNTDLARTVNACKGRTWIVSPLDPKAEALADTIPNMVQAPSPTDAQIKDMVKWIDNDLETEDKVIVVTQKGVAASGYTSSVLQEIRNYGLRNTGMSFNILEGRQVMDRLSALMTERGTNRVVVASDSKAFVIEVVRLLYLISSQKKDIVLYSTSKLRTFDEIDVEQLHRLNLHSSVSYHVDYDSKDVQTFLMKYRAVFNTEPSRSAFQGYDLMKFFTTLNTEYGRRWDSADSLEGKGLQSDFHLVKTSKGGYVNEAVRRIVYSPDYSINLAR